MNQLMRNYPAFPRATPHQWAGSPRVPHPSATFAPEGTTFDLHALGTPPALILSQDQTLHQNCCAGAARRRPPDLVHIVRASLIDTPAHRPPKEPAERTRRSSIFGRPVCASSMTASPSEKEDRFRTSAGSQPVNVQRFPHHAEAHPSSEGRLIYHVSVTDVKDGLRGFRGDFASLPYETGAAWTPVAQES